MFKPVPKPIKKSKKKKRKKLMPFPALIRKADRVFSLFIRNRDSVAMKGRCCTCGAPGNQAGHFVKRSYKAIRWHPQNVHLQCTKCNHFLDGNEAEYSRFIINTYGLDIFHWLLSQKQTVKVTREMVQAVISAYE